jgi:hypothetical protein
MEGANFSPPEGAQVVVDAVDPARLGRWWASVLDFRVLRERPDEVVVGPAAGGYPSLCFVAVPDPKDGRKRLRIDLDPDDREAEVERLLDMGARHVEAAPGAGASSVVLADPEGNEFCVLGGPRP